MKVLFVSNLFPNCHEPARGIFNFHQIRHLAQLCEVQVLAPYDWFPIKGRFAPPQPLPEYEEVPLPRSDCGKTEDHRLKTEDTSSMLGLPSSVFSPQSHLPVHHSRNFYLPKIGRPLNPLLYALSAAGPIRRIRESFPFDLIYVNWAYPDACGIARVVRQLGVPFVVSISGSDVNLYLQWRVRRWQILRMLDQAAAITVRSQALKELLLRHGVEPAKIHVLYNGVEQRKTTDDRLQTREGGLLYVGRLSPEKGLADLLQALALLGEGAGSRKPEAGSSDTGALPPSDCSREASSRPTAIAAVAGNNPTADGKTEARSPESGPAARANEQAKSKLESPGAVTSTARGEEASRLQSPGREAPGIKLPASVSRFPSSPKAKGQDSSLPSSVSRLQSSVSPPPLLTVVGDGPQRAELQALATSLGLADRVVWLGAKRPEEIPALMAQADLLCIPSHMEGVPNVALEAFASGLPMVATRVGGIPEVMTAETGILVEPRNPSALAAGIEKALARAWDQAAIREHAKRFSWEENARSVLRVLAQHVGLKTKD